MPRARRPGMVLRLSARRPFSRLPAPGNLCCGLEEARAQRRSPSSSRVPHVPCRCVPRVTLLRSGLTTLSQPRARRDHLRAQRKSRMRPSGAASGRQQLDRASVSPPGLCLLWPSPWVSEIKGRLPKLSHTNDERTVYCVTLTCWGLTQRIGLSAERTVRDADQCFHPVKF